MTTLAPTLAHALRGLPKRPDRGFSFVRADGTERFCSWATLLAEAENRARHFVARGVEKGDRIALVIPDGDEFVLAFAGACLAGAVPVPIYPQLSFKNVQGYHDTVAHIAGAAGAKLLVTTAATRPYVEPILPRVPSLGAIADVTELHAPRGEALDVEIGPDDLAFLQFTSGSTARPKGVMVTHANLSANAQAFMVDGLRADPEVDRGVSWLPMFHDMGLIGFVIAPIFGDIPITFLPTASFVRNPRLWLDTLDKRRGTITYAPNFAYALVTKRLKDKDAASLDLSCVRVLGCGAEPVQASTLRAFAEKLAPARLDPRAFVPSYGMAESTLAITFAPLGRALRTDRVTARSMQLEAPEAAQADAPAAEVQEIVSCGVPFPGHELRIVDPENGAELGERRVGEIRTRGPSVCAGYWEAPDLTAETFKDGWLCSGDLGYLADGELYICGRIKDVIIIRGRNFHPQDIEWVAGELEGVRRGNVVAFSVSVDASGRAVTDGLGEEQLVVCAEGAMSEAPRLEQEIASAVNAAMSLSVHKVEIVPLGSLPRTSSGKPQRRRTRQMFLDGALPKERALPTAGR